MAEKQIFISYSRKNREFAMRLYEDLLWDGYSVWIDKRIEEGKKWRPQIDDNLKNSNKFIALISSDSIKSEWVNHEGSMAYALDQLILPVKIKGSGNFSSEELPVWVEEIQLFNFTEGDVDYERELKKLKQRLGKPIPIQSRLEELLIQYQIYGRLLSEVELNLIEKHKKIIVWPEGKEELANELIDKSKRALRNYWVRYASLERDYVETQREINSLKRQIESETSKEKLGFAFIVFLEIVLLVYMYAYLF
jgi:hypothetical protein